jgi:hypothetical protein
VPHQRIDWLPFDQDPGTDLQGAAAAVAGLHRQAERERFRARLVEALVAVECEPPTDERVVGGDLPRRSVASLRAEAQRLRFGLIFHPDPPAWWAQRLAMIVEVVRRAP